ncbi:hypothetical protein CXF85_02755 [Colwellia sp. 75C3]|uniref:hypothetical protein n=1 Tax=Colwellia sp. 75C3 TaxID=888425 RepID=UPI000C3442D8|nr:hypothetical protein [Colwellia sp. 75C3]PKG85729.1 hypothetical protein CXF85_02755 [Colwellia sp. 75C3]
MWPISVSHNKHYSVESLYYHPQTIKSVIQRISKLRDIDTNEMYSSLCSALMPIFEANKTRFVARLIERKVKEKVSTGLPNWQQIEQGGFEYTVRTDELFSIEMSKINEFIQSENLTMLISRYPIRETQIVSNIVKSLGLKSKDDYEQTVRKMLNEDANESNKIKALIQPITVLLDA